MNSIVHYNVNASFILICTNLKKESINLLLEQKYGIKLMLIKLNFEFNSYSFSPCTIIRIFSPWIIDEFIPEILYLDSDFLCRGNISELWNPYFKESVIAMCFEMTTHDYYKNDTIKNYNYSQAYCNAGLMKINLIKFRQLYNFNDLFEDCISKISQYKFLDQDYLNRKFNSQITILNSLKYNFYPLSLKKSYANKHTINNALLIHFSGIKPWNYKCSFFVMNLYIKYSIDKKSIALVKKAKRKKILYLPYFIFKRLYYFIHH